MTVLKLIKGDRDDSWQNRGACNGTPPHIMFPNQGDSNKRAKAFCKVCPVRVECLEFAIEHDERFGVWGGKSERERRAIRKQRRPVEQVSDAHPDPAAPFAGLVILVDEVDTRVRDGLGRYADGAA
jgi:WhiB family redox-sensing transcriptional regulator